MHKKHHISARQSNCRKPKKTHTLAFNSKRWLNSYLHIYSPDVIQRADLLEKTLKLGKTEGRRWRGRQRMRRLDGITDSTDMSYEQTLGDSEGQGSLACCIPRGCKESEMTERLNSKSNSPWLVIESKLGVWGWVSRKPQHPRYFCISCTMWAWPWLRQIRSC